MTLKGARWFYTALLCLAAASAAAGSFSVAPTRVEFEAGKRTAVISLRNTDNAPLRVQAALVEWQQVGGEDVYIPTREVLATPPVFTVPPNGEQVVRIALRRAADGARELPYRIFFQEVPQPLKATSNTLNVALRIGVPIFVGAVKTEEGMYLDWQAQRLTTGEVEITATNQGTRHVQIMGFQVLTSDAAAGAGTPGVPVSAIKYVLPGSRMSWKVSLPAGADLTQLRVDGHSDQGDFAAQVAVVAP